MRTNTLHPQSDCTVESYVKAAEENLMKVVITKQIETIGYRRKRY
jgi:hypothetical protein